MKSVLKAGLLASLVVGAIACQSNDNKKSDGSKGNINPNEVLRDGNLTHEEKAEKLAQMAEQLLSLQGFPFADQAANLALNENPNNLRAQFIKVLLAPIMAQKGLALRVQPLSETDSKAREFYQDQMSILDTQIPNTTAKNFLKDGKPEMKNEKDVQSHVNRLIATFKSLRLFAQKNKSMEMTMMASDSLAALLRSKYEVCKWQVVENSGWDYVCSVPIDTYEVKITRADMEALQQMGAGLELAATMANSYSLTGVIDVLINHKFDAENQVLTDPGQILEELKSHSEFGLLQENHIFAKIRELGADSISGMRWIMDHQRELCPVGTANPGNRQGYFFNEGICLSQSPAQTDKILRKAQAALNGEILSLHVSGVKNADEALSYDTSVRPMAILENPVKDIRSLGNVAFNKCNQIVGIGDQSINGFFVRKDANKVLEAAQSCSFWDYVRN